MRLALPVLLLASCSSAPAQEPPRSAERDLVKRYFEAFNRHDLDAVAALYAPDAEMIDPSYPEPVRGLAAIRTHLQQLFEGVPDIRDEVRHVVAEPGRIAVEFVATGTAPGSAAPFAVRIASFFDVEEGQIVRDSTYYDR